jgi:hypothetical protein
MHTSASQSSGRVDARRKVMAGRAVANRSEPFTVTTPRGSVEVVRQQWRSQRPGSRWQWEWLARRAGLRDSIDRLTAMLQSASLLAHGRADAGLGE